MCMCLSPWKCGWSYHLSKNNCTYLYFHIKLEDYVIYTEFSIIQYERKASQTKNDWTELFNIDLIIILL